VREGVVQGTGQGRLHPRVLGWRDAAALAVGGSNQSLFLLTALVAAQGSAAIPLLVVGLLLSWAAAPGWTELTLMWPDRVGGIAASCAEAFRPYSSVLSNLAGTCYWWGWVPTCGLTAILSASALHTWYFPQLPTTPLAVVIVLAFTLLNLAGIARVTSVVRVMAAASAGLALLSAIVPLLHGDVDPGRAVTWDLTQPFTGVFGGVTGAMAGLYLVGFAAPAFEAAACHVGEMRDPVRTLPRAMLASGLLAALFFVVLPVVWLGRFGAGGISDTAGVELATALGPTFAPLFGGAAKAAAIWFMVLNMFHGTVQPLAGASRTLSQLSEDGLLPVSFGWRNRFDVPWLATTLTAGFAILFLLAGDPVWLIAAANFTYLIGIGLPSVAVWLLRRNMPALARPWRAPRGTIGLGVAAAGGWFVSTVLGFRQFGLPVVVFGLALAYSGSALLTWRRFTDRRRAGNPPIRRSIHLKLTGAMLAVMVLDAGGYGLAVSSGQHVSPERVAVLEDIFVAVAILTIGVGLVLPGMIAHSITEMTSAATGLTRGTLTELTRAMTALGAGDLDAAHAAYTPVPVNVTTQDEVGAMAAAFNDMQDEVGRAAQSLDVAREELLRSQRELQYAATHDALTELPNRSHLEREVDRVAALSAQHGGSAAVVVLDLDGFKYVNDSRGHAVGDALLVKVASLLRGALRPGDVAGRLGGDEFAVVLANVHPVEAVDLANQLLALLRAHALVVHDGKLIRVSASVGVAFTSPGLPRSAHDLIIDADVAMYEAKDAGRDRLAVTSTTDPRQDDLRSRHEWVERIRDALDNHRFVLLAQPIHALVEDPTERYELLLRMVDHDAQLIPPGLFLPTAERTGLIAQIDRWVVGEACQLLGQWQAAGRDVSFEVNVSGPSMGDPELLAVIRAGLTGITRPGSLVVEVTETAAIVDLPRAQAFAHQLAGLGIRLALDDFGAGYGSFYYLKHLPFDYLKIDGEFIRNLATSSHDQIIVSSLVTMAHQLGKATIAEFVEDAAALAAVRALGVDYAQGYHFGRPGPLPQPSAPRPQLHHTARPVPGPREATTT